MDLGRLKTQLSPNPKEPMPDMGRCSDCGWSGPLSKCPMEQDGDWETGYYDVPVCPRCDDGGCLDDYYYSWRQWWRWKRWRKKKDRR